jgi:hypothetical protein
MMPLAFALLTWNWFLYLTASCRSAGAKQAHGHVQPTR